MGAAGLDHGGDGDAARGRAEPRPRARPSDDAGLVPIALGPMPADPLVSVLVPNKDYGRFLGDALESVRTQTYERFEAIVVDDGSSDDSVAVASSFADRDPRFSVVRHDRSRGQGAAFNSAFARASGQVIAFLDADDTFGPAKLERVVAALRSGDVGVAVHPLVVTDAVGAPIQRIPALTRFEEGWLAPRVLRRGGRWRWVPTSGVAMRREVADVVFPMPEEGFTSSADTYFLMLVPLLTPVAAVDEVLGTYRRHGANVYARARLDPERTERLLGNMRLSVDEVNRRLGALGRGEALRLEDNLKYRELVFQSALFDGRTSRRRLLDGYRELAGGLAADDLYGSLQRRWARVMYLVAVVLPGGLRVPWLSASLSASATKDLVRRLVARGGASRTEAVR